MLELKSANLFWTGMLMPIVAVGATVAVGAAVPVGATVVVGARAKPHSRWPRLSASAPWTPRIHRHAGARHTLRMPI